MRDAFIGDIQIMEPNKRVAEYLSENSVVASQFDSFIPDIESDARYLDLSCSLDDAFNWVNAKKPNVELKIDQVNLCTSSLTLDPEELIDFWGKFSQCVDIDFAESRFFTGKGCNSFLVAISDSIKLVKNGLADEVINICIELHPSSKTRISDYAFFSDGVSIVRVSSTPQPIKCDKTVGGQVTFPPKFFPYKNSLLEEFYMAEHFHTLHVFDDIYERKYGNIPAFVKSGFRAHMYGIDPIASVVNKWNQPGEHVIHVESPPNHMDTLLLSFG